MNDAPSKFDPRPTPQFKKAYRNRRSLPDLLSNYTVAHNGCWEWGGNRNRQGYGVIGLYINGASVGYLAPRLQWNHCEGEIPEGMVIMHTCDNPPCINPEHLKCDTYSANQLDAVAKGRRRTGYGSMSLPSPRRNSNG